MPKFRAWLINRKGKDANLVLLTHAIYEKIGNIRVTPPSKKHQAFPRFVKNEGEKEDLVQFRNKRSEIRRYINLFYCDQISFVLFV
jgi:hypothetical protein